MKHLAAVFGVLACLVFAVATFRARAASDVEMFETLTKQPSPKLNLNNTQSRVFAACFMGMMYGDLSTEKEDVDRASIRAAIICPMFAKPELVRSFPALVAESLQINESMERMSEINGPCRISRAQSPASATDVFCSCQAGALETAATVGTIKKRSADEVLRAVKAASKQCDAVAAQLEAQGK